ncbi:hypothetical protein [Spiroplasma endosymbiont of Labia minor]|uniref:hypothetical protein n=1 Tax=Spiroplasma endosymbiont of Labia minor TaxID=3066305 RepID=UPI0030D62658
MTLENFLIKKSSKKSLIDNSPTSILIIYKQKLNSNAVQFYYFDSFAEIIPGIKQKFNQNEIKYLFDAPYSVCFLYIETEENFDFITNTELKINAKNQGALTTKILNSIKFTENYMENFYAQFLLQRPDSLIKIVDRIKQKKNINKENISKFWKSEIKEIFKASYLFSSINRTNKINCIGLNEFEDEENNETYFFVTFYNKNTDNYFFEIDKLPLKYSEKDFLAILKKFDLSIQTKTSNSIQTQYRNKFSWQAIKNSRE